DLHLDRDIQVGAGQMQSLTGDLQAHAGECRQRRASCGSSTAGSGDGLQEHVAFDSELHPRLFLSFKRREVRGRTVGAVDWGKAGAVAGGKGFGCPAVVPSRTQGESASVGGVGTTAGFPTASPHASPQVHPPPLMRWISSVTW